jgi:hypothetical protein
MIDTVLEWLEWNWPMVVFPLVIGVAMFGVVMGAIEDRDLRQAKQDYLKTECTYIGTVVRQGFGSTRIKRFDCGGVIEEVEQG